LGWFDDETTNIETIMAEKGEIVRKMLDDGDMQIA
jgi:hypothetical protein